MGLARDGLASAQDIPTWQVLVDGPTTGRFRLGPQDVGHEGVATGRGELSLRSFLVIDNKSKP
ncbi:hypothetical protein [Bacillus sp. CECT 9360]|uniref:hypothetical protein n=1 Tax=Bacillus sp. CECT 9360 TaxID=2845821 RepID=UPI001E577638|nr:hypothetical protein [Bacillus sp. CECT 9360]